MSARRLLIILAAASVAIASTTLVGYAAYVRSTRDLLVVEPDEVYRSGPADRTSLEEAVLRKGLRAVVDVGAEPLDPAEMSIVRGYGLRYVRFAMPGDDASLDRMAAFAKLVSEVPRPVLVRSSDGMPGSRLAAAVLEVAAMGRMPEQAWAASTSAFERLSPFGDGIRPAKARFDEFVLQRQAME